MTSSLFSAASGAANIAGGAVGGVAGQVGAAVGKNVMGAALGALMGGGRRDPQVAFNYMIEIDGLALGMFTDVSGIKWSMQIDEIKEGGVNNHQQHLLGRAKFDPLVLKRGFVANDGMLYDMLYQTFDPNIPITPRKIVHVVILKRGSNGGLAGLVGTNEIGRLSFYNCFVEAWEGPNFATTKNEIAVESITFRYDWLTFHPGGALDQLLGAAAGAAMSLGAGALAGKTPSI